MAEKITGDLTAEAGVSSRRKSMDPVSEFIRLEELPNPGNRFVIQELIGIGTSSKTYSALDQQKGTKVAIKIISNIAENILEIESEYRALCSIDGKGYIPIFHGAYVNNTKETNKELWFVMELCDGETLLSFIRRLQKDNKALKENEISAVLKSMLIAIYHLHSCNLIHRDIRASNFILSPNGSLKLFDFGTCFIFKDDKSSVHSAVGAPHWMAPEVISCEQKTSYSKSCDIWSFGITAIELAESKPPLHDVHPVRCLYQIARNPPPTLQKCEKYSDVFKDFIDECLVKNPEHRPCAAELLCHPFITNNDGAETNVSIEEHLAKGTLPTLSVKDKKILEEIGNLVEKCLPSTDKSEQPYMTFKNGYFKCGPDSAFVKALSDDAACLEQITEENVLELLHQRYLKDDIYTFIGDILIFVHPKKKNMALELEDKTKYCEKARSDNAPHICAVADRAYQQTLHHKKQQVVLFLGESNSGKSTLASEVINHLAFLGQANKSTKGLHHIYDLTRTLKKSLDVALKIQQICPLLDAFGNVSDSLNTNASRYIKNISVTFTKTGKVSGAVVTAKLMENYRFASKILTETNFHVFYYLYEGLKSEHRLSDFGLENIPSLRYLPGKNTRENKLVLNSYSSLITALRSLNFSENEISSLYSTIASLLLLGNVEYKIKGSSIEIKNLKFIDSAANNLKINKEKLVSILCKAKDIKEALFQTDALCLFIYEGLFNWIVTKLNRTLSFSRLVLGDNYSVKVVDVPGYQNSSSWNDFSHLNCNVLNDQLQNRIQKLIFIKELEEYKEEDLNVPFRYEDCAIRSKQLDDRENETENLLKTLQSAADSNAHWTNALNSRVESNYTSVENNIIRVKHIHNQVLYKKDVLLPKHMTCNYKEFFPCLKSSKNSIVSSFWDQEPSNNFWGHLKELPNFNDPNTSDFPHVVICVNPNTSGGNAFSEKQVLRSIQGFNFVETALIRKQGYARRLLFLDFLNRYKYLAFDFDENVELTGDNCRLLLLRLKMEGWMLGRNKVFLKYYTEEYLSRIYEQHVKKIIKVQAMARRFIVKARQSRKL